MRTKLALCGPSVGRVAGIGHGQKKARKPALRWFAGQGCPTLVGGYSNVMALVTQPPLRLFISTAISAYLGVTTALEAAGTT